MQLHHLELTPPTRRGTRALLALASLARGATGRRVAGLTIGRFVGLVVGLVVGTVPAAPWTTAATAGFSSSTTVRHLSASAASFSQPISPTATAIRRGPNVHLSWAAVAISSGDPVSYRVMRTSPGLSPVQACTGADTPVTSGGTVTCIDRKPGAVSSYTVQAYVVSSAGTETWSLPAGSAVTA